MQMAMIMVMVQKWEVDQEMDQEVDQVQEKASFGIPYLFLKKQTSRYHQFKNTEFHIKMIGQKFGS
jgi:hypothetical protein